MKIGVMLPSFTTRAERVLEAATEAERAGLHGVFAFDHVWQPETDGRPSLAPFPLLGAVAALTERVRIGTLVARVAFGGDEILLDSFASLDGLSSGRVVAGIGTGDRLSAAEHVALGLPYAPAPVRRAALERCAEILVEAGIETWIGGGGPSTNAIARRLAIPVNLWSATPEVVASNVAETPVTWGGVLPSRGGDALVRAIEAAGASWAVFTWGKGLGPLLDAVASAGIMLG
jgi:alkanesulfonate monooxygenase SsuD/methylene tetrahydromethanopterin reductase-like flavin-dependent oxidoreductase (luciferase family)